MFTIFKKHQPTKHKHKILFIVKRRNLPFYTCDGKTSTEASTGLLNSARFVVDMLNTTNTIEAKLVEVIDNNCIDKVVSEYNPNVVIIEALWVVPEKFDILKQLHPNVEWVVRLHSEIPFLSYDGVAFDWMPQYINKGIKIAANSPRLYKELIHIYGENHILYQPNYYEITNKTTKRLRKSPIINISCFGAVRPFKNHLLQAICAIKFADTLDIKLNFHINGNRTEDNGNAALKNLRQLFINHPKHELIEHQWMPHDIFLKLVDESIDISMQVSLTETFNIVTADAVNLGIPVLVSSDIFWMSHEYKVNPTSSDDIINGLHRVYNAAQLCKHKDNINDLKQYNTNSKLAWTTLYK